MVKRVAEVAEEVDKIPWFFSSPDLHSIIGKMYREKQFQVNCLSTYCLPRL